MLDGQTAYEKLGKMTEDERRQCAFFWIMDPDNADEMREYVSMLVDNNYYEPGEKGGNEQIETAKRLAAEDVAYAINRAVADDEVRQLLWDAVADALFGVVECRMPVRDPVFPGTGEQP